MSEGPIECRDLNYNVFLRERTDYDIDVFESYFQRVEKIISKGKISTDHQYYEINNVVDQLCQIEPVDQQRIELLNKLLTDYEIRKSRKLRMPK